MRLNKYRVAETIVSQILEDLSNRVQPGSGVDFNDDQKREELTDKWEDIVIAVLEKEETGRAVASPA